MAARVGREHAPPRPPPPAPALSERLDSDAVVVGGGPAGLAAATWLARYRRGVVVLDGGPPRSWATTLTHGYLGSDPVPPGELLDRARSDLDAYPSASRRPVRATAVRQDGPGRFTVATDDGAQLTTRRLVLATGVEDELPPVQGIEEHYGASAFHCPTCDGYEARDRRVVVLGWGAQVAGLALELMDWAAEVTMVTGGRRFEGDERHRRALARHGVPLVEHEAAELVGPRGDLQAVCLADGRELACDLVFFSVAHHPRTDLAVSLGCRLTDEGCLEADAEGRTSVDGVYGAGDITPGMQLVAVAVAKGTMAGVACALSLQGEPAASAAPTPGPDAEAELP
ncbi:MAG: NAD(P)/FAD-dependent oxidoreductase [Acidimicrobiales bacterium]